MLGDWMGDQSSETPTSVQGPSTPSYEKPWETRAKHRTTLAQTKPFRWINFNSRYPCIPNFGPKPVNHHHRSFDVIPQIYLDIWNEPMIRALVLRETENKLPHYPTETPITGDRHNVKDPLLKKPHIQTSTEMHKNKNPNTQTPTQSPS